MKSLELLEIYAGSILIRILSSRGRPPDSRGRNRKKNKSSKEQKSKNKRKSWETLELMLATNFPVSGSAIVMTLTYGDKRLPKNRDAAKEQFKYFLKNLREERQAAGLPPPVVFWAPEVLTSTNGRWHFHAVIDNTGRDYDMIRGCWNTYGEVTEFNTLKINKEKNHATLAQYMSKELRECQDYEARPGLHSWTHTRNAKRPEIVRSRVPADYVIEKPDGCIELGRETKRDDWSRTETAKFRLPAACFASPPKASRKRKL